MIALGDFLKIGEIATAMSRMMIAQAEFLAACGWIRVDEDIPGKPSMATVRWKNPLSGEVHGQREAMSVSVGWIEKTIGKTVMT